MSSEEEAVEWLRQRIRERLYLAQHAIELGSASVWTELSSGVLMTVDPDAAQDTRDGVHPLGDSSLTRLMEANDPQDVIARCEAELGILGEHGARNGYGLALELYGKPGDEMVCICKTCETPPPCKTVRLLAGGYKHRPGYPDAFAAA
jgi:uncharacterized protein DUF6221